MTNLMQVPINQDKRRPEPNKSVWGGGGGGGGGGALIGLSISQKGDFEKLIYYKEAHTRSVTLGQYSLN